MSELEALVSARRFELGASLRRRLKYLLAAVFYLAIVRLSYEAIIVPIYGAWGFGINNVPTQYRTLAYVIAFLPALVMPRNVDRPSRLICHLQYLVIYVPCCLILYDSVRPTHLPNDVLQLSIAMLLGMLVMIAMSYLPSRDLYRPLLTERTYWQCHLLGTAALVAYLVYVFGSFSRIASFEEVYEVRLTGGDIVTSEGHAFANYAQLWLGAFFLPLIFARGLSQRRKRDVAVCIAGYVYLFSISGAKAFILSPIILAMIWYVTKVESERRSLVLILGSMTLLLVPFGVPEWSDAIEGFMFWYQTTVNSRMFSIPQLALGQYMDFFANNPTTYLAHVRIVDFFLQNPYQEDIPFMLGYHYYAGPVGLNIGMWGQDGIAGFGLIGIPIVSVLAGAFLWLLDAAADGLDRRFVLVAVGYMGLCFTNLSLFTTMLSGGGLLFVVAFVVLPRNHRPECDVMERAIIGRGSHRESASGS